MHNHRAPNNRILAVQLDEAIFEIDMGNAIGAGFNVPQISDVAILFLNSSYLLIWPLYLGSSVSLVEWIEVGTGGDAPVRTIPVLVDMESVLARSQPTDLALDMCWVSFVVL